MPNGLLTAADYENGGIHFVEGRVETSSLLPVGAGLAVGKTFVAILRGLNPVTGLKMSPQAGDYIVPLGEVHRVTVGGLRADSLSKLPVVPGLAWSDGAATIRIADSSGRSATFKPASFDDTYWGLVNHVVSLLASRADKEEASDVEGYGIEATGFEAMVAGALRYFPDTTTDVGELRTLECLLVSGEKSWAGLAILTKRNFGFFEYDECLLEDTHGGRPLLFSLKEISGCSLVIPEDFSLEIGEHIALTSARQPNLIIKFMLDGDKSVRLGIGLQHYTPGELRHLLKLVQKFLKRIDKRLAKRQTTGIAR